MGGCVARGPAGDLLLGWDGACRRGIAAGVLAPRGGEGRVCARDSDEGYACAEGVGEGEVDVAGRAGGPPGMPVRSDID